MASKFFFGGHSQSAFNDPALDCNADLSIGRGELFVPAVRSVLGIALEHPERIDVEFLVDFQMQLGGQVSLTTLVVLVSALTDVQLLGHLLLRESRHAPHCRKAMSKVNNNHVQLSLVFAPTSFVVIYIKIDTNDGDTLDSCGISLVLFHSGRKTKTLASACEQTV